MEVLLVVAGEEEALAIAEVRTSSLRKLSIVNCRTPNQGRTTGRGNFQQSYGPPAQVLGDVMSLARMP